MSSFHIQVHRRALLEFFDALPPSSRGHATAVCSVAGEDLGIGLLKHYLERREGATVTNIGGPVTARTGRGPYLDAWVRVQWADHRALFQVEVKNWSAHAIGGRKLRLDASPETLAAFKVERWRRVWDDEVQDFVAARQKDLGKVFQPMSPPAGEDAPIEPAICLWDAMHPQGDVTPWFSVPVSHEQAFDRLWVFSMSSYLRSLQDERLELEMTNTTDRLRWLDTLFARSDE